MGKLIAITGGIGSGKSVVSRIMEARGYPVYDCDSRAKAIMDADDGIKSMIAERISPEAIASDGSINRIALSAVVFSDPTKLAALNEIVHEAVRTDLRRWASGQSGDAFVETAILYQSGLDKMVDEVWEVFAPESLRIGRVCRRNGLTPEQVAARIASQRFTPDSPHPRIRVIHNDLRHSLLLQLSAL